MALQTWVLGSDVNTGLSERGNALLDTAPIASFNEACVGNNALEMRQGMEAEDLTGTGFTGPVMWVGRFVTNGGIEETWAAADNGGTAVLARKVNNIWSPVAFADTPQVSNLLYMQGVGHNGKLYLAYDSDVNRLHVAVDGVVRRVGFAVPPPATIPASGGAGATITRSYRVRYLTVVNGAITRRSEPSSVVTATEKLIVHVQRGALINEGETHWEVDGGDTPNGPWYRLTANPIPIATPQVDDPFATIPITNPSAPLGSYDPPPSAKYLATDGLSLMMGGAWEESAQPGETIPKQNRVWYTPPLGTSDIGDDERILNTQDVHGWTDVGDAGPITALAGPLYGDTYVWKKATVGKFTPTGNVDAPYALSILTNAIGCVDQRLLTLGEVGGVPAIIFADSNAVYALAASGGIACLSEPIGATMRGLTVIADPGLLIYDPLERVTLLQTSHSPPERGSANFRNFMFDTYKRRWTGFALGGAAGGWVLGFSRLGIDTTLGGGGMQIHNGCYAEQDGERRLFVCGTNMNDQPTIASRGGQCVLDIDQPFPSVVRYRKVFKPGFKYTVGCPTVYFTNPMGDQAVGELTLTATYIKDTNEEREQSVVLPATKFSDRLATGVYTFEGLMLADVSVLDLRLQLQYLGEPYASPVTPALTCVVVPYQVQEAMAQ